MTPWLLAHEHLWNSSPSVIFIEENNFFYKEYNNYTIISCNNLFSMINYIQNHLKPYENNILQQYQEKTFNGSLNYKLLTLKNLMEQYDNKKYYFFLGKNLYKNYEIIHNDNYVLRLKNWPQNPQWNTILCENYYNNNQWKILPYFHQTSGVNIHIYHQDNNNKNFYFLNHLINLIKFIHNQLEPSQWNSSLKLLNSYWLKNSLELPLNITTFDLHSIINNLIIYYKNNIHEEYTIFLNYLIQYHQWFIDITEINHLNSFNNQDYNYITLLWNNIQEPIIIQGLNHPEKNNLEQTIVHWSTSKNIYYYYKKKFVHMNQTNFNSLIGSYHHQYNLPWHQFTSKEITYNLLDFFNVEIQSLWLRSIVNYNSIKINNKDNIMIDEMGWNCYNIPLEPLIINSNYNKLFISLNVELNGLYFTKTKENSFLIIKTENNNSNFYTFKCHLLSFIIKKQLKNQEFHNNIYIIDENNQIINVLTQSMTGYFIIHIMEKKIHYFFNDLINQEIKTS